MLAAAGGAGVGAAGVAAAGAAVAGVGTGAAEVGAAALALGAVGALSAGFGLALAEAVAAAGAALALLAGVCAWTAEANEIIPATADNQKALLRRINTLSRLRISSESFGPSLAPRLELRNGAPSS